MLNLVQRGTQTAATPAPAAPATSDGVPQTPMEYNALLARQAQLRNQYNWLQGQRSEVARRVANRINSDAYRAGIESQLQAIDAQILQVDASLARTGQLIAQAPASALPAQTLVPPPLPPQHNSFTPADFLLSLSIVFVLFPLTIGFVRRMWRGSARPSLPPRFDETPSRLERLEGALETVAIEVERISESQRFMTRLMTETQLGSALVNGNAQAAAPAKALGAGERPFEAVRIREGEQAGVAVPAKDGH